jgi:uncharacterized protein YecE (DUF72 family)
MDLRIGTSGFQFESWKPAVYPHRLKRSEMFDYYCRELGFDCLELNAPFYHLPSQKAMETLARRAPEGFIFIVKAHHRLTHGRAGADGRPPLQETRAFARLFLNSIRPLQESGKLDGILAQFPPFFLPRGASCDHLRFLKEEAGQISLFVEFRHRDWTRPETFNFLVQEGIGHCSPDLPSLGSLPRFLPAATTEKGYFRLHGRSPDWFRVPGLRYRYSYSDQELSHFLLSARRLAGADRVYIFFNNCHAGAAIRNAGRARQLLHPRLPVAPQL